MNSVFAETRLSENSVKWTQTLQAIRNRPIILFCESSQLVSNVKKHLSTILLVHYNKMIFPWKPSQTKFNVKGKRKENRDCEWLGNWCSFQRYSLSSVKYCFFKKIGQPRPLFHLFSSFQTQITIFTTNKCEKCPSSIRCRDSNTQPLAHESPPITTRPGLLPTVKYCLKGGKNKQK